MDNIAMRVRGPDGKNYLIPARQKDDWDAWLLLNEGDDMPAWTPPIYAVEG